MDRGYQIYYLEMAISSGLGLLFGIHKCRKRDKMANKVAKWNMRNFPKNNPVDMLYWLDSLEGNNSTVEIVQTFVLGNWIYVLAKVVMEE